MAATHTIDNVTSNSFDISSSGYAGGSLQQMQISISPDFGFCVCPLVEFLPIAVRTVSQINQDTSYFIRVREVTSAGSIQEWSPTYAIHTLKFATWETGPAAVMIEPAIVVVPNPVLEWVSVIERPGYPAYNLGYDAPVAWEAGVNVNLDTYFYCRMAPEPIDTIALLMTNAPESATIRVYGGSTLERALSDPDYNSGEYAFRASPNLPGRPGYHALMRLPVAQAWPYWFLVVRGQFPGGVFHAEHCIFGKNRASKNHSVDLTVSPMDMGSLSRNRFGVPDRVRGFRGKRVDFDISLVTELQYETLYQDLDRRVGSTDPILVVPNSKSGAYLHDRILYGALTQTKNVNPASPYWTKTWTIESILP